jgi:hypothetical protein
VSAKERVHTAHANQEEVRMLIPPISRPGSLAPSVTTPHSTALPSPKRVTKCVTTSSGERISENSISTRLGEYAFSRGPTERYYDAQSQSCARIVSSASSGKSGCASPIKSISVCICLTPKCSSSKPTPIVPPLGPDHANTCGATRRTLLT